MKFLKKLKVEAENKAEKKIIKFALDFLLANYDDEVEDMLQFSESRVTSIIHQWKAQNGFGHENPPPNLKGYGNPPEGD